VLGELSQIRLASAALTTVSAATSHDAVVWYELARAWATVVSGPLPVST
jgi:hypothetical protein